MGIVKAYVDGSYDKKTKVGGFGIVYLDENDTIVSLDAGKLKDQLILSMWNVAGEIVAARTVLYKCLYEKIPSIVIYYDYQGIEKWAKQEWKRKNEFTQEYSEICQLIFKDVNVEFVHVHGHSGDQFNDLADTLAKIGSGIGKEVDSIDGNYVNKQVNGTSIRRY